MYLLHSQAPTPELAPALRAGGPAVYTALDPLDVQPSEEIDHLRQLSAGNEAPLPSLRPDRQVLFHDQRPGVP